MDKKLKIPLKVVHEVAVVEKFYVHKFAVVNLSKTYFLENGKKTCKPKNRDLNDN